jgi:hypothetical protein
MILGGGYTLETSIMIVGAILEESSLLEPPTCHMCGPFLSLHSCWLYFEDQSSFGGDF